MNFILFYFILFYLFYEYSPTCFQDVIVFNRKIKGLEIFSVNGKPKISKELFMFISHSGEYGEYCPLGYDAI
jgi:hypothetical protein